MLCMQHCFRLAVRADVGSCVGVGVSVGVIANESTCERVYSVLIFIWVYLDIEALKRLPVVERACLLVLSETDILASCV